MVKELEPKDKINIIAVIVTFNREDKLRRALECFDKQNKPVDNFVIVNNGSTDGTQELLEAWSIVDPDRRIIINNENNLGGAGGFYIGLEQAMSLNPDWIWVSDDDAYPEEDLFSIFQDYCENNDTSAVSAISSRVFSYGRTAIGYHRRIKQNFLRISELPVPLAEYEKDIFDLDLFSYCGTIIKKTSLEKAGLPVKDYFIQYDDSEHSMRIRKTGRIICIPKMKVNHNIEYDNNVGYQWKDYYLIRNRMDAIKRNFSIKYSLVIGIRRIFQIGMAWLKPDKEWARLFTKAVKDAWKGRLGIDSVYKPGWKPRN